MAFSRSRFSSTRKLLVFFLYYPLEYVFFSNHLQVNTCGFPPLEDREASLSLLMGLDFFGGGVIPTEETVSL
jgi:hypothetical protein